MSRELGVFNRKPADQSGMTTLLLAFVLLLGSSGTDESCTPPSHILITTTGSLTGRHRLTRTADDTTDSLLAKLSTRLRVARELLAAQPPSVILQQCSGYLNVTVAQSSHAQPHADSPACNAASENGSLQLLLRARVFTWTAAHRFAPVRTGSHRLAGWLGCWSAAPWLTPWLAPAA